ncbi:hypothetical protein L914_03764 [Phytophthora nicotianae]|uniref:Uncharacterized protein n=1 Tax=Phytophthora nicotianae TaxID=4792 RepID=W2NVD2_PHYNI|nr:hypothetical protein L914_03764 [Phytophthora nicotianae]
MLTTFSTTLTRCLMHKKTIHLPSNPVGSLQSRDNGVTMEEMNRPEEMKKSKLALAANTEESSLLK